MREDGRFFQRLPEGADPVHRILPSISTGLPKSRLHISVFGRADDRLYHGKTGKSERW